MNKERIKWVLPVIIVIILIAAFFIGFYAGKRIQLKTDSQKFSIQLMALSSQKQSCDQPTIQQDLDKIKKAVDEIIATRDIGKCEDIPLDEFKQYCKNEIAKK